MTNFYLVLGIPENASEEDIRKAYRRLAKQFHPDVNKSQDAQSKFILINKAYEILIDQDTRAAYDRKIQVASDPFYAFNRWVHEQKAQQEEEAKRKASDFLKKKAKIKESKMYYPYMILLYLCTITIVGISLLILLVCAFAIFWYHIFMFFFLLPFICLAAYILKVTLDEYKKYKALFS
jgi:hypothetical protein